MVKGILVSPLVKESKTALDSGFRIPGTGKRIFFQWNVDSGSQSLVGFRIPELYSAFQNLGFRILQQKGVAE